MPKICMLLCVTDKNSVFFAVHKHLNYIVDTMGVHEVDLSIVAL